jgi:nicotinamidase-related amidase
MALFSFRLAAESGNSVNTLARAALVIIDVQKAIDAPYHATHGPRNNPGAEANISLLLSVWRRQNRPVIHIRHDSTSPDSAYRPGQEGNNFKNEVAPLAGEIVVPKRTNSAFIGTDLDRSLRAAGLDTLVVTGVSTNNSVEAGAVSERAAARGAGAADTIQAAVNRTMSRDSVAG